MLYGARQVKCDLWNLRSKEIVQNKMALLPTILKAKLRILYRINRRLFCVHQSYILILKTLGMLNGSLNKKVLQFGSIFSLVVLVTSLISTSYIQNSKGLVQENEESAYLKFVTQTVNDSTNSSKNSSSATVQIPEGAKGPPIPPKGYLVEEIRDGLYWVTDGAYNTMFLVTDKGVVAVDAPPSLGQKYLRAIAEVTDKPVNYLIYSHAHIDHIGAAWTISKKCYHHSTRRDCS